MLDTFSSEYYHENGIYIPRLYGKDWKEWGALGLHSIKEIENYLAEQRIDRIGQNGNTGEHYGEGVCIHQSS